jgi:hypothetical protein
MKQLKISLPDDLRARLDAAAQKSGNSLAEEIRRRVEFTLEEDEAQHDPKMAALMNDIYRLVGETEVHAGAAWHLDPKVVETLRIVLDAYLSELPSAGPSALDFDPPTLARAIIQQRKKQVEMDRAWSAIIGDGVIETREDAERVQREIAEFSKRFGDPFWRRKP